MSDTTAKHDLWLDARYLDDHVLMTTADAWTWVMIPGLGTNLPTQDFINRIVTGVETIIGGLGDEIELHYHLAYRDLATTQWAAKLDRTATEPTPAWSGYLERMRQRMVLRGYQDRVLYLGVRLGARRALDKPSIRGATPTQLAKAWGQSLIKAAAGPDPQPSAREVQRWREVAVKTRQALASSLLGAEAANANDVAWLIRHIQRLGMSDPLNLEAGRAWGAGTVHSLAEAVCDNSDPTQLSLRLTGRNMSIDLHMDKYRKAAAAALKAGQMTPPLPLAHFTSHVAILPIGQMPEVTASPWLFHASALNFPVEVSARLKVQSNQQAEKDAMKAARNQRNALQDAADAGIAAHGLDRLRAGGASALHQEIAEGRGRRQIIATYRLIVAAETREELGERAEEVIRHYREDNALDITVQWPPGDQLVLWEELIPGQARRTRLYEQRQDLTTFAVGLPFSVTVAGDGVGPYVGSIQTGNPTPVCYDMATAAFLGKAPTLALTGTLGGGKTFLLLTLMDHFRMRGFPIIALDPKGDIKGHLLLKGRGDARFFDLSTDGQPGSLDPFTLVPFLIDPADPERSTKELADARWREETRALVTDVLGQLLQHVRNDKMDTAVAMALNAEMAEPHPSMWHFLETMRIGGVTPPVEARITDEIMSAFRMAAIGAHAELKNTSETQLGRLMFAPQGSAGSGALFQGGIKTTIVSLSGLDLPKDGRPAQSPTQRFSVALFSLVAHQARRMLQDLDYVGPRALIIDEAHQITALPTGRSLIVSNARMGRSRDIAMLLATQSAADLIGSDLRNVISAVFAFRTGEHDERSDIAQLLGRDRDDEAVHSLLPDDNAPAGTCLFLDLNKNLVLMRVDRWAKEYDLAFDTNPTRESVSAAGTRIVSDAFGVVHDPDAVVPGAHVSPERVLAAPLDELDPWAPQQAASAASSPADGATGPVSTGWDALDAVLATAAEPTARAALDVLVPVQAPSLQEVGAGPNPDEGWWTN